MAKDNTYLNNIDTQLVDELLESTTKNAAYFENLVDKMVKEHSKDLDEFMEDLRYALTQEESASTDAIERYYAELTNMIYFYGERLEKLNVYSSMSDAARQEVYNKAYLENSMSKDESGKSKKTVDENKAAAGNASQYQTIVAQVYEHAYKILKQKIDIALEMVSTLKNILKRRVSEDYLSGLTSNQKQEFTD